MIENEIYEEISTDDIPPNFKIVEETCGLVVARELIKHLGGININIPSLRSMDKTVKRYVRKNKYRYTAQTFARALDLSTKTIYNYIKKD
jgi:DNA-binding CsgD family transcriptional regulator